MFTNPRKLVQEPRSYRENGRGKGLNFQGLCELWTPGDQVDVRRTTPACHLHRPSRSHGEKATEGGVRSCIATGVGWGEEPQYIQVIQRSAEEVAGGGSV